MPGIRYARAGVVLTDLRDTTGARQLDLSRPEPEGREVGVVLDLINQRYGPQTVGVGRGGMKTSPEWEMRRALLSKRCTAHWDELPVATA